MPRYLADMTWPEVAAAVAGGATTVILPLGATEQHGPHLPLGTDTVRALALAERVTAHLPDALIAPPLPVGCSDEHTGFAGLLSLNTTTLVQVIIDCAGRMVAWGMRRLLLLSAHGGNDQALAQVVVRLKRELPDLLVWTPADLLRVGAGVPAIAQADGLGPEVVGLHAGEGETSEMLCLRPDLVRRAAVAPGYTGDMDAIIATLQAVGLRPVTPNGVLGDPRPAEATRGARYLEAYAAAIAMELQP
jgi:mycofactocin precursor peptide peptidase